MSKNGGNGKSIKENAVEHYAKELKESKLPAVLSSYMSTNNLPKEYAGIDTYVKGVRSQLISEAGGEPTQMQMVVLDGICETLILSKYITTYIGIDIGDTVIATNKLGVQYISEVVTKGFSGLQALLDKKIKLFRDLCEQNRIDDDHNSYLEGIMGKKAGTVRGKTGR